MGHKATRRHGAEDGRTTSANRCRGNWLRMRDGRGGLRHHSSRRGIALMGIRVLRHGVNSRARARLRSLLVAGKVVWSWRVWGAGSSRCMRVASVQRLHRNGMGLQRRERLRQRRASLKLVRRDGSGRRVCLGRGCRDTIARVLRVVHDALREDASREDVCCVFATARERETADSTGCGQEEGCNVETEQLAGGEPKTPKRMQQLENEEQMCRNKFSIVQRGPRAMLRKGCGVLGKVEVRL